MKANEHMKLNNTRIFYVEDDLKNRAIVQMLLEQAGAVVGFERWGRNETLSKLIAFQPIDLILLDLMFPNGVSGYDVFQMIRQCPEFAAVPIIAISAADPGIEMVRAHDLGFSGYISKPIDLRQFAEQISQCIHGAPVWHGG